MRPLRELLLSMTSARPPEAVVGEFVTFCRKTAVVLLRKKIAGGRLDIRHASLTLDDLAIDCVADLFSRGPDGNFIQIQVYLRGMDIEEMPEAELMAHMRRLVFAKVNQGIFRIYHDIDPSLSKIIRNIKVSINALENYTVVDRFGEPYIVPAACDPLNHLPQIGMEVLKEDVRGRLGKSETIPNLLAHLAGCLREQGEFCRLVPLVQVALMFRSLHTDDGAGDAEQSTAEMESCVADARGEIARACAWVKQRARKKYVGSGKVSREVYEKYFCVIERALVHAIVDDGGEEVRYFDELAKMMPGLTRADYQECHKSKLEYLGRIANRRALRELKKVF